jgi:hypothetical protein
MPPRTLPPALSKSVSPASPATPVQPPAATASAPPAPPAPLLQAAGAARELRLLHSASAATILYGDTGSGKTTLLATFAKWVWRKFHVPTRLVAADPGGYSDDILALIKLGIVEVWRIYTRDPEGHKGLPSETLVRACQGWWPVEIDPATGECPLASPLAPPNPDERFALAFDGLTSMQDYSMVDMGQRSAKGTLGGEGANMKTVETGDLKLGVGNRASVGFTQGKCRDWVLSSLSIPNLVCPPVFTALELKVLDGDTKLPVYGPKIAGQAKTADVPAWFGATLGVCQGKDDKGNRQWRLYLRDYNYPASDPTPHKAKIRASATLPASELSKLPEYLADGPDDPPLTKFNLGYLFDRLEEVRRAALDAAAVEFPDAPGLKPSTIGSKPVARTLTSGASTAPAVGAPAGLVRSSAAAPVASTTAPAPAAAPAPVAPVVAAAPAPTAASAAVAPTVVPATPAPATGAAATRPAPAGMASSSIPRAPVAAAPAKK